MLDLQNLPEVLICMVTFVIGKRCRLEPMKGKDTNRTVDVYDLKYVFSMSLSWGWERYRELPLRNIVLGLPMGQRNKIPLIILLHHDDTEDNSEDPESLC